MDLDRKFLELAEFVIVNDKCEPILGLAVCERFAKLRIALLV